jgi:hypothetical protein
MGSLNFRLEERLGQNNTASVITQLGIHGFKAFGNTQQVPIKPLTLIFGANSSGKSSIIHALLLAHHGMETGDYDVRQTKLAGDMVDLGGFRNYVHKHHQGPVVGLEFELAVDRGALLAHLDGSNEEKTPFCELSRFGLALDVLDGAVNRIRVGIDGGMALAFARRSSGQFRPELVDATHPFIKRLVKATMETSRLQEASSRAWPSPDDLSIISEVLGSGETPSKETCLSWRQKQEEEARQIRQRFQSGEAPNQADWTQFCQRFAEVSAADSFSFDRLVLRDLGPEVLADWPTGIAHIREGQAGGLVPFFQQMEPRNHVGGPWWAEAQALRHNLSALIAYCTAKIADVLSRISYLGPLRSVPSRYASVEGAMDASALASGGGAWDEIRRHPGVLRTVNGWLGPERLRLPYVLRSLPFLGADRLRLALRGTEANAELLVEKLAESPDSSILVFEDVNAGTTVSHRDIGFGVSQVLPVLVNAAAMREWLIAIEQPELHLHPAQQAELGDVFIESALGERRNTFLLETHSEHLILRVLRRVRETTEGKLPAGATPVRPEDVSVVFVEPTAKGALVRHLPVTPDGDFGAPWPGGFFAERFQDLP